jgi:ABC-2 type transport system permease protein
VQPVASAGRAADVTASSSNLFYLIRIYIQELIHYIYPPSWKTYFPFFSLVALGIALLAGVFIGFNKIFGFLNKIQEFPLFFVQVILERLVGLIFLICYSMIFMSSMINGLSSFYLSADLPLLFTLPLQKWKVLSIKFLENWITSCYLVLFFLAAFLVSHARSFQMAFPHYVTVVGVLLLFTLSPVALGTTMVTLLVRFFPVRRIHQMVTLMAVIFLGCLIIIVRMMQPEKLLNPASTDDFARLIQDLAFPSVPHLLIPSLNHLPSSWAASVVIYSSGSKVGYLALFALFSLAVLAITLRLFYSKAFVYSQESRSLRSRPRAAQRKTQQYGPVASLVRKDATIFARDVTQWSQLLLLVALIIVYLLNVKNLAIQLPMVRWVVSFINLGLAGFVLAALSVRFLFPSVSMEGRSFWIIRTLPVSFRKLLWCKYLIYFPPFLLFSQLLVYFSNKILQVPDFFLYLSMLNILAVAFALTGLAIGIGALMPSFKSDHPSRIAVGPGGVLYMLLSFLYLFLMLLIQLRPVWYYVIHAVEQRNDFFYFAGALLLTLAVAFFPMEWGARRLATREY